MASWTMSLLVTLVLCCLATNLNTTTSFIEVPSVHKRHRDDIGITYNFDGENPHSPKAIVDTLNQYNIQSLRIYEPNIPLLKALRDNKTDMSVMIGVKRHDIPTLANSRDEARAWVMVNVLPYLGIVNCISVGNEVIPGKFSKYVFPAIQNIRNVLDSHKDDLSMVRVTTAVGIDVLTTTNLPSTATFSNASMPYMTKIVHHLSKQKYIAPLLVNVYPYFAYAADPKNIRLDYAQFSAEGDPVVRDGNLTYMNMMDAMLDSFVWAMEKIGVVNVLLESESGWPHKGNATYTTPDFAKTYNKNFMKYILKSTGTPKRPRYFPTFGYIFSMIDEDSKSVGAKENFGVFKPNLEPYYDIFSKVD